jgi:hypothetical protein
MSYVKSWTFLLNQKPNDVSSDVNQYKSFALQLMAFLVAHGWTADGSSNGVSTSSTSNISGLSDIVQNTAGNAHSWQLLKSPVGLCAGLDGSYTGTQSCIWIMLAWDSATTYSILITGYSVKPTGGTTTANPTAATGNLGFTNQQLFLTPLVHTMLFHFGITTQGHFYAATTCMTTGVMNTCIILYPTFNPCVLVGGLDYPYATALQISYATTASHPQVGVTATIKTWNVDGTTATDTAVAVLAVANSPSTLLGTVNVGGLNRDGGIDASLGIIGIYTGSQGMVAEIADFLFNGMAPNKFVDAATVTRCIYGQIIFPCNAAIIS